MVASLAGRGRLESAATDRGPVRQPARPLRGPRDRGRRVRSARRGRRRRRPTPTDRVLLVDADPSATGDGVLAGTTALGIYDHGYVTAVRAPADAHDRGPALAHPRGADRARDRGHRAADRRSPTTTGPGSCSPARPLTYVRAVRRPPGRAGGRLHEQRHDGRRGGHGPGSRDRASSRSSTRGAATPSWAPTATTPAASRGFASSGRAARTRDRRGRPAARVRRLEPERRAVEPGPRHAPLRRADRRLRPGPARAARPDGGRRCGGRRDRWARRDRRRPGSCRRPAPRPTTRGRRTTSTSGATRPCATCGGRSARASTRSSTSSATRRSAPASTRDGAAGSSRARSPPRSSARRSARSASRPTDRRRSRSASPSWPGATAVRPSPIPSGRPRSTPWHVAHGAVFEDVGQWKRPRYFPRDGRVDGRGRAARVRAPRAPASPSMDATTLGKIDLAGPGRRRLPRPHLHEHVLDAQGRLVPLRPDVPRRRDGLRRRRHLAPGRGPVPHDHDDRQRRRRPRPPRGVAPDRVAGAAGPRHERDGAMGDDRRRRAAVPRGRGARSSPDLDVSNEAFPFMTWREAVIAGTPGRVFRISFSGELAYELNVPTWHGLALWEAVMAAGAAARHHAVRHRDDARPARREGLPDHRPGDRRHGHAAGPRHGVGRLDEEGLHRAAVAPTARRAPARTASSWSASSRSIPRRCCPRAPSSWPSAPTSRPTPVPMLGHVTSSYRSAALGRTFALALVKGGRERHRRARPRAARWTGRSRRRSSTRWCSTRRTGDATGSPTRDHEGPPGAGAARGGTPAGARPRAAVPRPGRPACRLVGRRPDGSPERGPRRSTADRAQHDRHLRRRDTPRPVARTGRVAGRRRAGHGPDARGGGPRRPSGRAAVPSPTCRRTGRRSP